MVRAREDERGLRRLAAIAVTAYSASSDRAIAAGFDMHVPKPVDADELVQSIHESVKLAPA
jgi:CheY-like chemotaxis protein